MSNSIKFQLKYPNPFTPVGVEFELHESGFVTLRILDHAGQVIEIVSEQRKYERGKHLITIDITKYTNNNYFLQILCEINGEMLAETKRL